MKNKTGRPIKVVSGGVDLKYSNPFFIVKKVL
jgi:hypothetical protein